MRQQHLVFLILGFCIIGIAVSAGSIAHQASDGAHQRQLLNDELRRLATLAQAYCNRSFEENGGDGTFIGLTATSYGIARITKTPTTLAGEFMITKSGDARSLEITGIGNVPGYDPTKPIKMLLRITANSTSIIAVN
jgi:hypothetical protein